MKTFKHTSAGDDGNSSEAERHPREAEDDRQRRPLLRASRRTRWECQGSFRSNERAAHATKKQMAALAVASLEFAVPVRRLRCDPRLAYAIFDAAWLSLEFSRHDESAAAREAAERDCLVISVGIVARAFALGFTHLQFGGHDQQLLFDLIARIEYDDAVTTQWHDYLRERAREFVAEPRTWTRVEILARQLEREQEMDVSRIAALLGEPLPKHLVVPTQIPWHSTASGEANVELVWRPPGLTEIIELAVAARPADGRKP